MNGLTPPTNDKVSAALVAAQSEMPAIPFDSTNPFLRNRYASLGSVIAHSRPILAKHKLAVLQRATSTNGDVTIQTSIVHESGQSVDCGSLSLSIGDEKGKSRAQVAGSIITYLRRYAWASSLGLYADEDDDGNAPQSPQSAPEAPKGVQIPSKHENAPKGHTTEQGEAIKHATETTRAWFISEFLNAKPNTNERLVCEAYFRALKWLGAEQPIDLLPLCYVPTSIGQARTILPHLGTFQHEGTAAEPWPAVNAPEPQKTGWRAHKVVWTKGKFANLPLGELPKDFLFQMWRTYEVKDTWEDKAGTHKKSEASMEKDKAFRAALDEAGKELNFREEPA